jgi:hypothetical protein
VIPEKDAKITDIEITPNVKDGQWRFSDTISWKAFAPPLSDSSVVQSIEVESRIGGLFTLAVEDGLLHIRWSPPTPGATLKDWHHARSGVLRSPDNLSAARIDQIRLNNGAQLTFTPQADTHSRMEVVSFGAFFHLGKAAARA